MCLISEANSLPKRVLCKAPPSPNVRPLGLYQAYEIVLSIRVFETSLARWVHLLSAVFQDCAVISLQLCVYQLSPSRICTICFR